MQASELRPLGFARSLAQREAAHARKVIARLRRLRSLDSVRILDIGAAQGLFLIACAQQGYDVIGVEPNAGARDVALTLAREHGVDMEILDGVAEQLPLPDDSVDVVHAKSVIEHVDDADKAFHEVYRVLRPGGIFWFNTASSMSPLQSEIRGFPGFGWYPDPLKRRVMDWAIANKPQLIGHTSRPAYHWFTPWKARRMLKDAGFSIVFDRWDLRGSNEGAGLHRRLLGVVRSSYATKLIADVIVPGCSYAAIK